MRIKFSAAAAIGQQLRLDDTHASLQPMLLRPSGKHAFIRWFADPCFFGDYPSPAVGTSGDRHPKFTSEGHHMPCRSTRARP